MYIPIGPNKKELYKIIIGLLLIIYLIFLGMYKPKAEEYGAISSVSSYSLFGSENITMSQNWGIGATGGQGTWANWGKGYLIFSFAVYCNSNMNGIGCSQTGLYTNAINGLNINVDGKNYTCNIGTSNSYYGNKDTINTYSTTCLIDRSGSGAFTLGFSTPYTDFPFTIRLSDNITFAQLTSGTQQIVDAISANSQAERTLLTNIINSLNAGNSNIEDAINQGNQNTADIKDSLNDSSIDNSSASDLTSNSAFQDSNGLDAIIKAPLNFIQSLTSSTCSSISLTIPYIDADVSLPCMSTIYTKALGQQLVNLIALVINGVVLYRYCLKILELVHNAKNPNKDELEVLDL